MECERARKVILPPELRLRHRWLDTWPGIGDIVVDALAQTMAVIE
jgi:hypothetical protein